MVKKKKDLLEQDATLRLIYAFNYFVELNNAWEIDSYNNKQNRSISENMGVSLDDAYFMFEKKFYSFNYHRNDDDLISCEIKEYDNFYDLATSVCAMKFEYVCENKSINILSNVTKKLIKSSVNHQKIIQNKKIA